MPFEEAQNAVSNVLASTPGARTVDVDQRNRMLVIEIPEHFVGRVRDALEDRFIIDTNAPLRY